MGEVAAGLGSELRCDAGRSGVVVVVVDGIAVDADDVGVGGDPDWSWSRLMRDDGTTILCSTRRLFVYSNKVNYGREKQERANHMVSRYLD